MLQNLFAKTTSLFEPVPGEVPFAVRSLSAELIKLLPVSSYEFHVFRKRSKNSSGLLTTGEFSNISEKKLLNNRLLHLILPHDASSFYSKIGIKYSRDTIADELISPFSDNDTITFSFEDSHIVPYVSVVFSSETKVTQIVNSCVLYGGLPIIVEPFWGAIARNISSSKSPIGKLCIAFFEDSLSFGTIAYGIPIFQSSVVLEHFEINPMVIRQNVQSLIQELRNNNIQFENQNVLFLSFNRVLTESSAKKIERYMKLISETIDSFFGVSSVICHLEDIFLKKKLKIL